MTPRPDEELAERERAADRQERNRSGPPQRGPFVSYADDAAEYGRLACLDTVRRLIAEVRASRKAERERQIDDLRERMSDWSEGVYCAGWLVDLDMEIWRVAGDDGADGAPGPEPVPLAEWAAERGVTL